MRARRKGGGRRRAGFDKKQRALVLDALVAAGARVHHRLRAHVVIGEDGGDEFRGGRPHAVEQREAAIAVTKKPEHRHHPVDRPQHRGGRREGARGVGLAERKQVEQQVDHGLGIAADMAAVRQHLRGDLDAQHFRAAALQARLALDAHAVLGHRKRDEQPVASGETARQFGPKKGVVAVQRAREARVEVEIGVGEDDGRLRQPGQEPPARPPAAATRSRAKALPPHRGIARRARGRAPGRRRHRRRAGAAATRRRRVAPPIAPNRNRWKTGTAPSRSRSCRRRRSTRWRGRRRSSGRWCGCPAAR